MSVLNTSVYARCSVQIKKVYRPLLSRQATRIQEICIFMKRRQKMNNSKGLLGTEYITMFGTMRLLKVYGQT